MHAAWLIVGVFSVIRLFYAQSFLLSPDETNYWQWSRHLAWGYHDQAPMIAWTIHLATLVFGHKEFAVRLPSILALAVASIYLIQMAKSWFGERLAFQTALFSQSIFLFNVGALLATADGIQAACWAGAACHTAFAFRDNSWHQWLLGGIWFGFGLLSKYTIILFLPCILLYALLSGQHRRRLAGFKPYVACLVGLALFAPVIFWNASNDWNSVRHVAYIGGANQGVSLHLNYLGDYVASQAGLLTPLVFLLICASWYIVIRRKIPEGQWIYDYLFFTSFPVIAGFALLSLHSRVYGNWPGFGYVTAILLATALFAYPSGEGKWSQKGRPASPTGVWKWTVSSAYILTFLVLIHVLIPILPIPIHLDRTKHELQGWDELGQAVEKIQATMRDPEHTFLFGARYQVASELAFYAPGKPYTVSINRWNRPNVYDYWWQDSDLLDMDAVGVFSSNEKRKQLLEVFEHVEHPEQIIVYGHSLWGRAEKKAEPLNQWYAYRCFGFKGGLRWIPSTRSDVRAVPR